MDGSIPCRQKTAGEGTVSGACGKAASDGTACSTLKRCFPLAKLGQGYAYVSAEDGTVKYLFGFGGNEYAESVLMKYKYGYTICVSTQIGCKMGCSFCASTLGGYVRSLLPSEILGQIYTLSATRISESPILSSWAWVNRSIILIMLCVFLSL